MSRLQRLKERLTPAALAVRRFAAKVFLCKLMGAHDWTCAAQEGIPPTKEQLEGGVRGFFDYAATYCRRCPTESLSSLEAKAKASAEAVHG